MHKAESSLMSKPLTKRGLMAAAIIAGATLAGAVQASGSFGPSAGGNAQNPYNLGKAIYHKKLTCKTCPLAGLPKGKDGAMMALEKLTSDEIIKKSLNAKDRKAVGHYLNKRYKL